MRQLDCLFQFHLHASVFRPSDTACLVPIMGTPWAEKQECGLKRPFVRCKMMCPQLNRSSHPFRTAPVCFANCCLAFTPAGGEAGVWSPSFGLKKTSRHWESMCSAKQFSPSVSDWTLLFFSPLLSRPHPCRWRSRSLVSSL